MRLIQCQELTATAFSRFGVVIDASGARPELINGGTTRRFADLATFDAGDDGARPVLAIYAASARSFALRIAMLERHCRAGQAFIPLGMQRFVVLVAPGSETPDWDQTSAFVTRPGQGICLSRGTWHHGLIALDDADRFLVIEGSHYRDDTQLAAPPDDLWLAPPPGSS